MHKTRRILAIRNRGVDSLSKCTRDALQCALEIQLLAARVHALGIGELPNVGSPVEQLWEIAHDLAGTVINDHLCDLERQALT